MRETSQVGNLIEDLVACGVELPDAIVASGAQLRRLHEVRNQAENTGTPQGLVGLDDETLAQVYRDLAIGFAIRGDSGVRGASTFATNLLSSALADQLADELEARGDEILDQLRPAFDPAALLLFEATELGIGPWSTDRDIVKSENVVAMQAAWTGLPDAVDTLDRIANIRMNLTGVTGMDPTLKPRWDNQRPSVVEVAGSMFRDEPSVWYIDFEQTWQRWLRLSVGSPARLLSKAESAAVWHSSTLPPETVHVAQAGWGYLA